jgi:putative copper resistance protein D
LPRLAVVAWAVALAATLAVAAAVWHYLDSSSSHAMHGMAAADAIARGGGRTNPLQPLFGSALLTAWQLDGIAVVLVVLAGAWYLTGVALVPVRTPGARWPLSRTLWFAAGLAVVIFATCGSIAVYDQALFTAHMAGHLALVMLAPALLMAGRPLTLAVEASRPATRVRIERLVQGRVVGLLTAPPVALATYTAVIVGSHLTGLMDTIMRSTWAGQLEHLVYLVVGCQFFVLVIGDEPLRWKLTSPPRWLLLAVAMAVDTFTGIVLLQGTHHVALAPSRLDVDALSDTHTGGAIMWFGGDAIMAVIMIALVVAWLRTADAHSGDRGWLERARRDQFREHTGVEADESIDDDEAARSAYNAWLQRLDQSR